MESFEHKGYTVNYIDEPMMGHWEIDGIVGLEFETDDDAVEYIDRLLGN